MIHMKSRLSFLVDILLLILIAAVAGMGFLMKWVLPSGSGHLQLLGITRHEWGTVHLWFSLALLALLVLHIWLAWSQIVCKFRLWVKQVLVRWLLGIGFLVILVGLLSWPFAFRPTAPKKSRMVPCMTTAASNTGEVLEGKGVH